MIEINEIHLMDCMEGMRLIRAEQEAGNPVFAKRRILAVVDPPYGEGSFNPGEGHTAMVGGKNTRGTYIQKPDYKEYDLSRPSGKYWKLLFGISENQVVKGGNYFAPYLPASMGWIVWDKCNGGTDQSDSELLFTSFGRAVRNFKFMWSGMCQGKSIFEGHLQRGDKSKNEKRVHMHQTPWQLWAWLLDNYAKPGDLILDTHSGSGSVARACVKRGFDFIAFEIDADCHRDSLRLLNQTKAGLIPRTAEEVKLAGGEWSLFDL